MAVCHLLIAVHFYLKQNGGALRNFGSLQLLCVATFIAGLALGLDLSLGV
jgi:hypothetical protein